MKPSQLLLDAYSRVQIYELRAVGAFALDDSGAPKTRVTLDTPDLPTDHQIALCSIGSLKRSLMGARPSSSKESFSSLLFNSDAYAYLYCASRQLGFDSVTDMNDKATKDQYHAAWFLAILSSLCEDDHF